MPETSGALGFGFRCGFLGLLHMEIVRERLEREFDLALIATAPSVEYRVHRTDGDDGGRRQPDRHAAGARRSTTSRSRTSRPRSSRPSTYTGTIMDLCQQRRGEMQKLEYLSPERVELDLPHPAGRGRHRLLRPAEEPHAGLRQPRLRAGRLRPRPTWCKVDILLNGVPVDAFSMIVHRDKAYDYGRRMAEKLKELIPRQLFDVPIQAAIGGRIIARETVKAKRKDVLAKCYGGDITRKRKLLEKQKEGKKRMKKIGRVEVPQEAFIAALRLED